MEEWIRETKDDGYHYGEGYRGKDSKSGDTFRITYNNDSIEMAEIEIMSDGPMTSTFNRDLENEIFGDVMIMDNDAF